jgi:hypothetical protein
VATFTAVPLVALEAVVLPDTPEIVVVSKRPVVPA